MIPPAGRSYPGLPVFSACITLGTGIYLPYFPVWMASQGLGDGELALVIALILLKMGHGLIFGAMHLGTVSLLSLLVSPQHRAQAQGWLDALRHRNGDQHGQ